MDIPHAATVGDHETRAKILDQRVGHAVVMLQGIFERAPISDISWSVGYLRSQLAKHPAGGYKPWAEAMAELKAAQAASASTEGDAR